MIRNARIFKLVIIGDGGVGKTTLTKVFCNNPYVDQIMTIGIDIHAKDVMVDNQKTILQIWDISGQDQFKFMIPDFVHGAKGAILAFDCTRFSSFRNLNFWLDELRNNAPDAPVVLIATKCDQTYDPALSKEQAIEYIQSKGLIDFVETSAKERINVNLPFKRLLEQLNKLNPDSTPIDFLGPEEEFKPTISAKSSKIASNQSPIREIQPINAPELQKSISSKELRSTTSLSNCDFCNAPLRESQIKLKQAGQKVLCHNCYNLT